MRRILCMGLIFACMISYFCFSAEAAEVGTTYRDSGVVKATSIQATGSFDMTIGAYRKAKADTSFPLEAGETVTIKASYTPFSASVDFGLIDSNNIYHFINVTDGSINMTIKIEERGNYTLAIRNNSGNEIQVSGFVNY